MATKETVIIVHGTFAAPVEGKPGWYEPGSAFCRQLDERLGAHGSQARCWAHLEECGEELRRRAGRATPHFSWSGRNSWTDRSAAAQQLLDELDYLIDRGWKWKLVAHSHGGNAVLEAFDLDNPNRIGGLTGNCVLLGTPILHFASPPKMWSKLVERLRISTSPMVHLYGMRRSIPGREPSLLRIVAAAVVSLLLWVLAANYLVHLSGFELGSLIYESTRFWMAAIGAVAVLGALYWGTRYVAAEAAPLLTGFQAIREMVMSYPPRLLFINSERDEAYGFLAGVRAAEAWPEVPGAKNSGRQWFEIVVRQAREKDVQRYPWDGRRLGLAIAGIVGAGLVMVPLLASLDISRSIPFIVSCLFIGVTLIALIAPGPMFFAVAAPWRLTEAVFFFAYSLARRLLSDYARRHAWRTLQELALGVTGSPHPLGDVTILRCPDRNFARGEFLYEELAKGAEDAAVAARSHSLLAEFQWMQQQSDTDFWRLDQWRDRIGALAADPNLIHTVYYRHPDVIEQIARHLARSKEELYALRRDYEVRHSTVGDATY